MAKWLEQASQWHEMYWHNLEFMSLNPGRVELWVRSISVKVIQYYFRLFAWGHYGVSYVVWWRYALYYFQNLQCTLLWKKLMFTLITQTKGWCSKVSFYFCSRKFAGSIRDKHKANQYENLVQGGGGEEFYVLGKRCSKEMLFFILHNKCNLHEKCNTIHRFKSVLSSLTGIMTQAVQNYHGYYPNFM